MWNYDIRLFLCSYMEEGQTFLMLLKSFTFFDKSSRKRNAKKFKPFKNFDRKICAERNNHFSLVSANTTLFWTQIFPTCTDAMDTTLRSRSSSCKLVDIIPALGSFKDADRRRSPTSSSSSSASYHSRRSWISVTTSKLPPPPSRVWKWLWR